MEGKRQLCQGSGEGIYELGENSGHHVQEGERGSARARGGGLRTHSGRVRTRGGSSGHLVERTGRGRGRGRGRSRGRGRGRGRGRRGQGRGRGRDQTRPDSKDDLNLVHIDTLPTGPHQELPLNSRRKRAWTPYTCPSTSGPLRDVPAAEGSGIQCAANEDTKVIKIEPSFVISPTPELYTDTCPSTSGPLPDLAVAEGLDIEPAANEDIKEIKLETSFVIPTAPELFVGHGPEKILSSTLQNMSPPRTVHHRGLQDDKITFLYNIGSESEESDEEGLALLIPRTYQNLMETPDAVDHETSFNFTDPNNTSDILDTHKPHKFFDFDWTAFPQTHIPRELRRETFSNINCGPTSPFVNPLDTFTAIWDRQFMEYIAAETNRYAQELVQRMMSNDSLHPQSRICDWQDTTPDEIYVYFAVFLAMGVVVKTKVEEYWGSTPDIFYTPGFSAHMSLKRFQLLSRCIHFNNNRAMAALELDASAAKLYKIQPVISHLNSKFQRMYNLHQNIALDESLRQWKGWLGINQSPNEAAAVGIKSYEICDAKTGYLWKFEVHAQKKSQATHIAKSPLDGFTPTLVLNLINGLENRGHTLWMDNFYNSPALARRLKSIGFDCVGTLSTNRQFVPDALTSLTKANMQPGQITGFTSGDIDLMVWRDINRIAMISTYHGNAVKSLHGSTKPILMLDYSIMMGGVDKKDQMLSMYPIERMRTRIWYKKFFRRLLNVSVLNSYILVKHSNSSFNHPSFRIALIKSLLEKHSPSLVAPAVTDDGIYLVRKHHLAEYPFLPGKSGRLRRHCTVCSKRVQTFCVGCDKAMCMTTCFVSRHQ